MSEKRVYYATRTSSTPTIDGIPDDPVWEEGAWTSDFLQQYPTNGGKATFQTKIKILYDYDNLYIIIYCLDDDPDKIRRIFNRRDKFSGDMAGIAIDSYNDKRTAYEFNVTAAGQKIDLKHSGDKNFDQNWDAVWDAATSITDSGWVAEMRIPFSQLRYSSKKDHSWGLHVWRWIDRVKEESQWQLIPQDAPAMVYLFGRLEGISNIRSSRQVELLPYVSSKADFKNQLDGPQDKYFHPGFSAGLDAKIGISSNFTLDATINPDFGQVEADPSVLNLTAYETFYEEKRPFFLEGQDIFDFRLDEDYLFYSRRIGKTPSYSPDTEGDDYTTLPDNTTILGSAKLSGKTSNGLSIGIMNSLTTAESGTLYSGDQSASFAAEPLSNYFVSRVKKESNNANTIYGFSFNSVNRIINDSILQNEITNSALTGGIDFTQYWKNKYYYVSANLAGSRLNGTEQAITAIQESHIHRFQRTDASHLTLDTTRTSLTGTGGTFSIGKSGGRFKFNTDFNYWSPQLNTNDLGFMREADMLEQKAEVSYESTSSKGFIRKYIFELNQRSRFTFGNELTHSGLDFEAYTEYSNLYTSFFHFVYVLPSLNTRELRGGPGIYEDGYLGGYLYLQSNTSKDLFFSAEYGYWWVPYYFMNAYEWYLEMEYHPIDQIKLIFISAFERNNFRYQYIDEFELDNKPLYLMGFIERSTLRFTLRAELFLTPEISFQYFGSPYFSVGHYRDFKRVDQPSNTNYYKRYHQYSSENVIYNEITDQYTISETGRSDLVIDNPDFEFGQFRSNFVFRWEYKLGSVLFLVWTHEQTSEINYYAPDINNSFRNLFKSGSGDVLLLKLRYWFSF